MYYAVFAWVVIMAALAGSAIGAIGRTTATIVAGAVVGALAGVAAIIAYDASEVAPHEYYDIARARESCDLRPLAETIMADGVATEAEARSLEDAMSALRARDARTLAMQRPERQCPADGRGR